MNKQSRALPFPRTKDLPEQSPLFWVENKDRFLRQLLIRDIEEMTNRPLGVYFAQRSMKSSINQADVDRLYEVVMEVDTAPFDLMIETRGGDTDAAEAMISVLMSAKHKFRAIIPNTAKSNGTLLCLASEELVMGPTSELGPIEPLVENIPASFFSSTETDKDYAVLKFHAEHALNQTKVVAARALKYCMLKGAEQQEKIQSVIEALCGRVHFPSHGSVIDASQAEELGLNVTYLRNNDDIWSRIWLLYCMLRHDTQIRNIQKVFENRRISLSVLNGEQ